MRGVSACEDVVGRLEGCELGSQGCVVGGGGEEVEVDLLNRDSFFMEVSRGYVKHYSK